MSFKNKVSLKLLSLKEQIRILEEVDKIYSDACIYEINGMTYYCSAGVNTKAKDIQIYTPGSFQGTYSFSIYQEFVTNEAYPKFKIYGMPLQICIFEVNLNDLTFFPYEKNIKNLKILPEVRDKVNLYILDFIKSNKIKINNYGIPTKIKSLLAFT